MLDLKGFKMKGLVVKKSLIAEQDLLLGRQSETQERGRGLVNVDGIELIKPVRTIADLKTLNPKKYETAFLYGENTLDILDIGFQGLDEHINELYYFDFTSEEAENLPYVVKSELTEFGRWKLAKLGEKRLYRIAVPLIAETIGEKTPEILEKLDAKLDEKIDAKVQDEFVDIHKQGLLFNTAITYAKGDMARVLVKTHNGVQDKMFLYSPAGGTTTTQAPLTQHVGSVGSVPVYADNLAYSEGWVPLPSYHEAFKVLDKPNDAICVDIFHRPQQSPQGVLKLRVYDSHLNLSVQFELEFVGFALNNFRIKNVYYSDTIKLVSPLPEGGGLENLIYYPSFAIMASEESFKLHFMLPDKVKRVECDFTQCNIAPLLTSSNTILALSNVYAIREGGGSYIHNLGQLSHYFWGNKSGGISRNFKLFMLGQLEWASNLVLNKQLFHQFFQVVGEYGDPNIDVSDVFLRNVGARSPEPCKIQSPQLPNIRGGWDGEVYNGGTTGRVTTRYSWRDDEHMTGGHFRQDYWGAFKRGRVACGVDLYPNSTQYRACYGWQIDAKAFNPIYSDAGDTRPKTLATIMTLQAF